MDEIFTPDQKSIYKFADGTGKIRCADPLVLLGNLKRTALMFGKTIDAFIDLANRVDAKDANEIELADAWQALATLAEISRKSFGLSEFNEETGEGADTAHALGVLNHFHQWCEKKNQTHASQPISTPHSQFTSEIQPTTAT